MLPRFVEMERTHGSLGRAMLASRKKTTRESKKSVPPIFTSLKNGMQQLADAVVTRLAPSSLLTNTPVLAVQYEAGGWLVSAGLRSDQFDSVIVALPAPAAANLWRMASAELAAELAGIPYTSSITVALGYDREARRVLPPGFGFLVPRSEGRQLLAATFVHNKFPHRAPDDRALLRCFFVGASAEKFLTLTDEQIIDITRGELQQILGLRAEPRFARVYKWKSAMAQYTVGHLDRLERVERLAPSIARLGLGCNAYRGIGVPDCVRSGSAAVADLIG